MIWHIVKKDLKLWWPSALAFGSVHWLLDLMMLGRGRFGFDPFTGEDGLNRFGNLLGWIGILASAVVATVIVQQDRLPGVRQDWLVRPIRRLDLLAAKFITVLILVLLPNLLADLTEMSLSGFGPAQSFGPLMHRAVWFVVVLLLPVLALSALTNNLLEAIVGAVILEAAIPAVAQLAGLYRLTIGRPQPSQSWADYTIETLILAGGAGVLLVYQYLRRNTIVGRWAFGILALGAMVMPHLSVQHVFALEKRLAPEPGAANSIGIQFVDDHTVVERKIGPAFMGGSGDVFVLLPMQATGLTGDAVLDGSGSNVRITLSSGEVIDLPHQMALNIRKRRAGEGDKPVTYGIRVPQPVFQRIADQPVRVELTHSMTLLRPTDEQVFRPAEGESRSPGLGWCGTKLDDARSTVLFGCVTTERPKGCVFVALEHPNSGARYELTASCPQDGAPFSWRYDMDALERYNVRLVYGDDTADDPRVVKASQLGEARVVARLFEPRDRFTRQVVIPQIKLRDWGM